MTTPSVFDAAAREKEVTLTTYGRKTGKPNKVTIWITTDGEKLFVRSGKGFRRDWPQNLMARGDLLLSVAESAKDPEEARTMSRLMRTKYGAFVKPSQGSEPLTDGEQATFELIPA